MVATGGVTCHANLGRMGCKGDISSRRQPGMNSTAALHGLCCQSLPEWAGGQLAFMGAVPWQCPLRFAAGRFMIEDDCGVLVAHGSC